MRYLVTGAGGFIGSHVVRQLAQQGHSVQIMVRSGSSLHRLNDCLDGLEIRRVDLSDYAAVHQAVAEAKPECAIHAAWYAVPGRYWTAPENLDCVTMSLALAKALANGGCRRFVGIGSCFEYDYEYGYLSENLTPLKPRTLYAVSKDATRSLLESFCPDVQMSFAWVRIFYVYGPGEQEMRLVPSVILSLMKGITAKCTEGLQVRDYLCVEDVASALVAVAQSGFEGAVNIGSGEPVTVRSIVQILGEALGRTDLIALGAMKSNPVDPPFVLADVRRLREQIGWHPSVGLQEGLQRAVLWWKKNPRFAGTDP
jgi:UDP-glucuronate decarboxylase